MDSERWGNLSRNADSAFRPAAVPACRTGRGAPLLLLWIHSLFVGIAIVLLYVATNTLFLAHLPAQALPYAYVVSALLGVLAGVLYRQARRRLNVAHVFTGLLLSILSCLLLLRLAST
ncbi:MAG: hypothetical protein QF689_08105 [Candidatus Latescibacteria bacterium]|nr:hypothetical protein [Candidatus Latescibacterota bacterium]